MRLVPCLAASLVLALCAGCPDAAPPAAPPFPPVPATTAAAPVAIEDRELPVKCGCAIESVKKCSEWAEVDGRWVKLVGDHGLGSMPFCQKEGLRARVSGQLQGDELRVTKVTVLE